LLAFYSIYANRRFKPVATGMLSISTGAAGILSPGFCVHKPKSHSLFIRKSSASEQVAARPPEEA